VEIPPRIGRALDAAGFDLRGVLPVAAYDALVPPPWRSAAQQPVARSAVLLACGGRALFRAFQGSEESRRAADPLDAYTERIAAEAARGLVAGGSAARVLFAHRPIDGRFADFVALGRACGLGSPSRLGLLVHPAYGPWLSLRAVVLTGLALGPTPPLADFDPCADCPAPCAAACRGAALRGDRIDVGACASARAVVSACRLRCDARRACPLGREHAYDAEAEAHHMAASFDAVAARRR
jgi:hypothetical protein